MKTLYESILASTKSGVYNEIKKWCDEHNVYDGKYIINKDNTISPTIPDAQLRLHFMGYDHLPDYIKFKEADDINVIIGPPRGISASAMSIIKSFEGLPVKANSIKIALSNNRELPKLKIAIKTSFTLNAFNLKSYKDLEIDFYGKDDLQCELNLKTDAPLKNIQVKHVKTIDFVNDFNIGDAFSKAMNRKSEKNKYKGHFEHEIKPEGYKAIEDFFKDTGIDLTDCICIQYTQASQLLKKNGKWYRFKNWS